MTKFDDEKTLRTREADLKDDIARRNLNPAFGSPSILAQTTTLSKYPTSSQSYFACTPNIVLGTEIEGTPGIVTPGFSTFFALNVGTTIPPSGTFILATLVGSRWIFRYDG